MRNCSFNLQRGSFFYIEHPTEDLETLQEEFSEWLLSQNPDTARYVNIHTYDDEIRDYSLESFDNIKVSLYIL
jgi:hypothetical protein